MKKLGFSKEKKKEKEDEKEPAVIFPGSEESMRRLADVYDNSPKGKTNSLSELVQQPKIKKLLLKSNVFIYGKVGFFDYVISTLQTLVGKNRIKTIFTEDQLLEFRKEKTTPDYLEKHSSNQNKSSSSPFILVPMTETPVALNRLITNALIDRPLWLVAIPSLLNRSLLLSFNCFFLPNAPETEMKILYDITSLTEEDIHGQDFEAIFIADHSIKELGLRNRIGTVIPIDQLD